MSTFNFNYTYGPESISVQSGSRVLWTFYFNQAADVQDGLQRLADGTVSYTQMPELWDEITINQTTRVTSYGRVTFSRKNPEQSSTTSHGSSIVQAWCVEMLRIYNAARM